MQEMINSIALDQNNYLQEEQRVLSTELCAATSDGIEILSPEACFDLRAHMQNR